jgi:hypothetical protein
MRFNHKVKITLTLFLFMAAVFSGCYKDKEELLYPGSTTQAPLADCDTLIPPKFNKDILPIFLSYCAKGGCHDAASAKGGRTFTNYTEISAAKEIITTRALIIKDMPQAPNQPLADSNINKLNCWLVNGAPNN